MPGYFVRQAVPRRSRLKLSVAPVDGGLDCPYTARAWLVDPENAVRDFTRAQLAKTVTVALGDPGAIHDGRVEIALPGPGTVALTVWIERDDGSTYSKRLERSVDGPKADVWFVYCRVREDG